MRTVTFETTHGPFRVELHEDQAPVATGSFVELAEEGAFDGIVFLRVIPGFMLAMGRPGGDEEKSPGHPIDPEADRRGAPDTMLDEDQPPPTRDAEEGILSMTSAGPGAEGPHLYVTLGATPWLDRQHAILGRVVGGDEVLREIAQLETDKGNRPIADVTVSRVAVQSAP